MLKGVMSERRQEVEPSVEVPRGAETVQQMWREINEPGAEPGKWDTERWDRVTGRKEVENLLIPWCAEHFNQAEGTPFARGKWNDDLDILKDNSKVEDILEGKYEGIEDEEGEVKQWLEEMKRKKGVESTVPLRTDFSAFQGFIRKVPECKTSSPSGRHYGHYKALAENEKLLRAVYVVLEIAIRRGIVLRRWKEVRQVLLLKDPPEVKINRFRNVTIVEADLMFIMKHVWAKGLGDKITEEKLLNESQYARRGQVAQNNVLNKRLSYDLQHTLRMESFQADNDAVSCYDRIVVNIAAIATMRLGLGGEAAKFLVKTLREFRHKIMLGGVPSMKMFCDSLQKRMHGTGQGTGWSPVIWSAVDDIIISLMERCQPGQIFDSPDGRLRAVQMLDAYVDDSNLSVNQMGVEIYNKKWGTNYDLEEAGRRSFQAYNRYLRGSGGKLGMPKCRFY